jgi:ribosomal protein L34
MTRQRKGERKNTLTPERTERLRNLGFVFRARSTKEQSKVESIRRQPSSDANWMRNFEILKEFRERMGHTLVPKVYKENQTFSSW